MFLVYSVFSAFDQFYQSINLGGDHRELSNQRKDHLVNLLSKDFTIIESFSIGSIPKYTALKNHADLDIMVALHYGKHIKNKSPGEVLQNIRDSLGLSKNNVRKNGQAVTLYYKTWPNVDVVPVSRSVNSNNEVTHYNVPNINTGKWIISEPKKHSQNLLAKSSECGENFKKIIKMIKWWNINHGRHLQSYHIEVLALNIFSLPIADITWGLFSFFCEGRKLLESPLWNETHYVDMYLNDTSRENLLKRFDNVINTARSAWYSTHDTQNDHRTAIMLWKQIFGEKLPSYG